MFSLPNYTILSRISQSPRSDVYRAYRDGDRAAVVIKVLRSEYPGALAQLQHEAAILQLLSGPGIVKLHALEKYGSGLALVLGAVPGQTLDQLAPGKPLELPAVLQIGIAVADTLDTVHGQRIVHRDVRPGNILVDAKTASVHLLGFGSALQLGSESAATTEVPQATLTYIAPEQTGRMNRKVDTRADLYSLGVTLYELLTGEPPFTTTDPVELSHSHLARTPASPTQLVPTVPAVLASLVMKLLAKAPEDRYQTAYGLKVDLQECLRRLQGTGQVADFTLGSRDKTDELRLPQRLYGRAAEVKLLQTSYARTCQGAAELVLVSGYSGIGKTALVDELRKPALSQGGFFVAGKFDQLNRISPYSALAQALRQLVTQLLAEPAEVLAQWRHKIQGALGNNGLLLTDLIPELTLIIGAQPSVATLGPSESQNRFNLVFQSFLRLFTAAEHPLVLFLDDLQWADQGSLRLLQALLLDPERGHLLIIGAYRDQEVGTVHPFIGFVEELRKTDTPISEIKLAALNVQSVIEIVAAMLGLEQDPAPAEPLARLAFKKTQGNPFFLGQFLEHLHSEKLLRFDPVAWRWRWEQSAVASLQVTDNVVELMAGKLQRFAPATQDIVMLAACIGYQFELGTLSLIYEKTAADTVIELWPAIQEGLILPPETGHRFRAVGSADDAEALQLEAATAQRTYRFLHDRVQQAAYSLIAAENKKQTHLRIGRLLLSQYPVGAEGNEPPFHLIDHLNLGRELIVDAAERLQLARMNLSAGQRAKGATAYDAAAQYLGIGIQLVTGGFDEAYALLFALYLEGAECEFLSGSIERADALFSTVLGAARTRGERGEIYTLRSAAYSSRGLYPEAMQASLSGLAEFGITYPTAVPEMLAVFQRELEQININLGSRRIEDLLDAPEIVDPDQKTIMKLYEATIVIGFLMDPVVMIMVMANACNYALKHGNSDYTPYVYVCYGYLLAGRFSRYQEAFKFGRLAIELNKKLPNAKLTAKVHVIFNIFLHLERHIGNLEYFNEGFRLGLETGDYIYASVTRAYENYFLLSMGRDLNELRAINTSDLQLMRRTKDALTTSVLLYCRQMIASLQGLTHSRSSLSDDTFSEAAQVAQDNRINAVVALSWYRVIKVQLAYLYGDYAGAKAMLADFDVVITEMVTGLYHTAQGSLWICLTLLALPAADNAEERAKDQAMLDRHRTRLAEWAGVFPPNYLHKHLLVTAESARVSGLVAEATSLYEQAIAAARANGFPAHAALANELAGKFYQQQGRDNLARAYLQDALAGYKTWGATAKVAQLGEVYGALLGPAAAEPRSAPSAPSSIDMLAVIRASQALSVEIALAPLLDRLLTIAIENAGAEKGVLLRYQGDALWMVAQGVVVQDKLRVQLLPAGAAPASLPVSILNYVVRTGKYVVVDHAAADAKFASDPYVQSVKLKSVLCLPLLRQGTLVAVLYLENNLTRDAFTAQRIAVLDVLAAQAAISLENATLYSALKHENNERRRAESEVRQLNSELEQRVLERTAELRAANRELESFSYSVSHDLRAPLRAIDGFSRALQEDYEDKLEPEAQQYLRRLRSGCSSMAELIEDMLRLARAATGEIERATVDISRMAAEIVAGLKEASPGRQVEVSISPELKVNADGRLLRAALENLLGNAWKYTSKQPSARIELGSYIDAKGKRVFFVRDNGAGFDMKYAGKLFAPFQRMHTAAQFSGTGVGLATVQRIIHRHGGSIWAEAAVDKGATFSFTMS